MGRGRVGGGLSSSSQRPHHPTVGGIVGKWSHKYVQNFRGAGTGYEVSERGQGQARATLVWGPWLLGWPRGSWGVPRLATMLAEVAVALNVGPHQVAHLDRIDLPAFAVANLQSQEDLNSCQPRAPQ